jgi:hypothetical protein
MHVCPAFLPVLVQHPKGFEKRKSLLVNQRRLDAKKHARPVVSEEVESIVVVRCVPRV